MGDGQFCLDCGFFSGLFSAKIFFACPRNPTSCIFEALLSFDFAGRGELCKLPWTMRAPAEVTGQGKWVEALYFPSAELCYRDWRCIE